MRLVYNCDNCGEPFLREAWNIRTYKRGYCSVECKHKDQGQYLRTEKSHNCTCGFCSSTFHRFKSDQKNTTYCSKECFYLHRRETEIGENNPNWKGGCEGEQSLRKTIAYSEWRTGVFVRDDFTCVSCKKVGGDMNAHHIKPYINHPELRLNIDNGVTLCIDCHRGTHRVGTEVEETYSLGAV